MRIQEVNICNPNLHSTRTSEPWRSHPQSPTPKSKPLTLRRFDCRLAVDFVPSNGDSFQGCHRRLDGHIVHQLTIEKPLPEQPNQKALVLFLFKQKGDCCRNKLDCNEERIIEQGSSQGVR